MFCMYRNNMNFSVSTHTCLRRRSEEGGVSVHVCGHGTQMDTPTSSLQVHFLIRFIIFSLSLTSTSVMVSNVSK